MNIDTLNAYCGNKLVLFPYLTQGRLNIHQAVRCLHWSVAMPRQSVDPRYAVRSSQTQLLGTCVLGCRRGRMRLVQRLD